MNSYYDSTARFKAWELQERNRILRIISFKARNKKHHHGHINRDISLCGNDSEVMYHSSRTWSKILFWSDLTIQISLELQPFGWIYFQILTKLMIVPIASKMQAQVEASWIPIVSSLIYHFSVQQKKTVKNFCNENFSSLYNEDRRKTMKVSFPLDHFRLLLRY